MLKRFNELNFVIGLFFLIVSLILLANNFFNHQSTGKMNLYTGIAFVIFGVFMITIKTNKNSD